MANTEILFGAASWQCQGLPAFRSHHPVPEYGCPTAW